MKEFNAAFWKWFGDSVVVDDNGDPLVVYHGTRNNFTKFKRTDDADFGFHFGSIDQAETRLERTDKHYRGKPGHIIPVFLSIQNPLKTKDAIDWGNAYAVWKVVDKATKGALGEFDFTNLDETAGENGLMLIQRDLENLGYDGIFYKNSVEGDGVSYIAFKPSQIKSADKNDGTWDADDADIRSNPFEPVYDPEHGMGATGEDIDYFGFIAYMSPKEFLKLNPPLLSDDRSESRNTDYMIKMMDAIRLGHSVANPALYVVWNKSDNAFNVVGHEGRHRAAALGGLGVGVIPVHVFPRKEIRARHFTASQLLDSVIISDERSKHYEFRPKTIILSGKEYSA